MIKIAKRIKQHVLHSVTRIADSFHLLSFKANRTDMERNQYRIAYAENMKALNQMENKRNGKKRRIWCSLLSLYIQFFCMLLPNSE